MPSAMFAAVLSVLALGAAAQCSDYIATGADCARNSYAENFALTQDDCCALCASEKQCVQWTFQRLERLCRRTSQHEAVEKGFTLSVCGVRDQPKPVFPDEGQGKNWAVIVAGSNGYWNYRHQADSCHAFQIVKAHGIPEEQIIHLAFDDIANNAQNPFKGKLFNKPDPTGPGKDVYGGCQIDYRGNDVTPENFLQVLSGKGSGKVLKSTAQDRVFVFFTDHGATGLIAFPSSELHKEQLQATLQQMATDKMFKELVFYLESCESGSMFEGMNISGVYALSASNPDESSWGTYCDSTDTVNGTNLGACLGDLFSVSWMEDSDGHDVSKETLQEQFVRVQNLTTKSHVMQWGDLTFTGESLSTFLGAQADGAVASTKSAPVSSQSSVSARQVDLQRQFQKYSTSMTSQERFAAASEMQQELARQQQVELVYNRFTELVFPNDPSKRAALRTARTKPDHAKCELRVHATIRLECAPRFDANSGFALQFHQIVVNVCNEIAAGLEIDAVALAARACTEPMVPVGPAAAGRMEQLVV